DLGSFAPRTPAYSMRYQTIERIVLNPWLWQKLRGEKGNLPEGIKKNLSYYVQYNQKAFDFLLSVSQSRQKTFCFTHLFLPHEPYAFTKSSIDSLTLADISDPKGYITQVEYSNELIKKIVAELKKDSRNIIIIQGDHGFRDYDLTKHSSLLQNEAFNAF